MYSVLIVDDEYYICQGLQSKIASLNRPEISEIRTCLSGEAALELCQSYKPQIVFTDIRMGEIDGIELIRLLNKKLHPVQFYVLSGYDDFSLVKGAFQQGASDYLLKPILADDLSRILDTACANLKNGSYPENDQRSNLFQRSYNILQQLTSVPPHAAMGATLLEDLSNAGFTQDCGVALLAFAALQSRDIMTRRINLLYDALEGDGSVLCNMLGEDKLCLLVTQAHYCALPQLLTRLLTDADFTGGEAPAISLSRLAPVTMLPVLYHESGDLLCQRLLYGYGHLYCVDPIEPVGKGLPPRLKHLVTQLIQTPMLVLRDVLRPEFYQEVRGLSMPDLRNFYSYFNEMLGLELSANSLKNHTVPPPLLDFYSYAQLETFLYGRLQDYAQIVSAQPKMVNLIDAVRSYIDNHYTESLTLAELSDRFFVSYSYLSKSFHKEVRMSFQEYLYMLRMEHAMELLQQPELSIQQIATQLSYENAFNFSRAFKTYYGTSPSHFRTSLTPT